MRSWKKRRLEIERATNTISASSHLLFIIHSKIWAVSYISRFNEVNLCTYMCVCVVQIVLSQQQTKKRAMRRPCYFFFSNIIELCTVFITKRNAKFTVRKDNFENIQMEFCVFDVKGDKFLWPFGVLFVFIEQNGRHTMRKYMYL